MKTITRRLIAASLLVLDANAQPFHSDTTVAGEQTLEVSGNLAVKQYGSGFGGDLNVTGEALLAQGFLNLPNMPTGVTGGYHGPVKIGSMNTSEFFFNKTGNETTGDFIAPLGVFLTDGGPLEVAIRPMGVDPLAGAAYYTLASTRFGELVALKHLAFGGGCNTTLLGIAQHGYIQLFLKFDARAYSPGYIFSNGIRLQIKSCGDFQVGEFFPLSDALPVKDLNSVKVPYIGPNGVTLDTSTTTISTAKTVLEGKVVISEPQGDISMGNYQ